MTSTYISDRQRQILQLCAQGCGYLQIAERLDISKRTVEAQMREICIRLEADNRTHAVVIALSRGLISSLVNKSEVI